METTKAIIDTDILIDLLRNKKESVEFINMLEAKKILLSTTVINAFELHYGAHKSRQPSKNLQTTKKLLSKLVLLPLTPRSAQKAGHLYAELETKGQSIGLRDTLIGAIALTREYSVATCNIQNFEKIADLKIISIKDFNSI